MNQYTHDLSEDLRDFAEEFKRLGDRFEARLQELGEAIDKWKEQKNG